MSVKARAHLDQALHKRQRRRAILLRLSGDAKDEVHIGNQACGQRQFRGAEDLGDAVSPMHRMQEGITPGLRPDDNILIGAIRANQGEGFRQDLFRSDLRWE